MKYILETVEVFRHIHIVEAPDEESALKIASVADDNWQEHMGQLKYDCRKYTEEDVRMLADGKKYFWHGVAYENENGCVAYVQPDGKVIDTNEIRVPK
jgi:hypothetical protein